MLIGGRMRTDQRCASLLVSIQGSMSPRLCWLCSATGEWIPGECATPARNPLLTCKPLVGGECIVLLALMISKDICYFLIYFMSSHESKSWNQEMYCVAASPVVAIISQGNFWPYVADSLVQ